MIRMLRKKFICSSMFAFGILLLILFSGVAVSGALRLEHTAQAFMQEVLDGRFSQPKDTHREHEDRRLERMETPMGYYLLTLDAQNEVVEIEEKGIWEPDDEAAEMLAERVLATGKNSGRLDGYRFRLRATEDGCKLALMDGSMQGHMLADMLRSVGLLSLGCMVLLFLILLPISSKVVRSYALHIEKQKQFITNAGHDIKTPVAIILSNVDAMELIVGENKWSRNIRGQIERLRSLLERMLFLARIDERSVLPATEELDLNAVWGAELETYNEIIVERNLRLDCDLSVKLRIKASREYMQQLAHVLLDNAMQYADEGGTICLRMEKRRKHARILLENSVTALPDCPPEALFDRFYRGDAARTQSSGGCGVGLSAAQAICEMHRGRISAEYAGETEIRFCVELPIRG